MLTIRKEQFAVLAHLEARKFEKWMLVHLKRFFPTQCALFGDQRIKEMVRHAIQRAPIYGITSKRDVCKYIDVMIFFGREFDSDERSRWAGNILRRRGEPGVKLQRLLTAAKLRLGNR
jgi:hypothetical protein